MHKESQLSAISDVAVQNLAAHFLSLREKEEIGKKAKAGKHTAATQADGSKGPKPHARSPL